MRQLQRFNEIPSGNSCRTLALLLSVLLLLSTNAASANQSIVALVNDEPISAYDIQQRMKLRMAGDRRVPTLLRKKLKDPKTTERFKKFVMKRRPKSKEEVEKLKGQFFRQLRNEVSRSLRSNYKKEVLEELIGERLMLQEAKKLNLTVTDSEVNQHIQRLAGRSKNPKTGKPLTMKEFVAQLNRSGVRAKDFRNRIKANLSLQKVVYRKYGRQVNIGEQEVDQLIATSASKDVKKSTEFQLQKVKFALNKKEDQVEIAKRLIEANKLRAKFKSCKQTPTLIKEYQNVTMQSLGKRTLAQIPSATKAIVKQASAGQMTPPSINNGVIELYAVCSKREVLADQKQRRSIQAQLKSQQLNRLQKKYLRDLRQDAFIEYR